MKQIAMSVVVAAIFMCFFNGCCSTENIRMDRKPFGIPTAGLIFHGEPDHPHHCRDCW
jgi:hypothetical protein